MPVQKNNKVQSKRTSGRKGGDPTVDNVNNEDTANIINKIIDMLKELKTTVETIPGPASANSSNKPMSGEEFEKTELFSESKGGKGKKKTVKSL